ncbi:efflux RND transporter periplasmic adaptor subunit [Echinicola soli]|uniref:Efflux RND transporter periplasmic adaptor subunit n=1 Tax=Echinicola soli TaxID=2591634 RepID=A0A514CN82_9BACT|nr:efflux RND transporter periplasmic adaptor subunit [Echinicola soli]QDH81283.1 efflux RND transporter periplasmic adaptor subunit [Echinicola soli]
MDRKIEKKKGLKLTHVLTSLGSLVFLVLVWMLVYGRSASTYRVNRENLSIAKVISGDFDDYINISGQVKPISTYYLHAYEGGRIVEKYLEEGAMVEKGDTIMKLENRVLHMEILNVEADFVSKQNDLRQTKFNFESDLVISQTTKIEAQYLLRKAKRNYEQEQYMFDRNLISREDYIEAKENYELAQKKMEVSRIKSKQDSLAKLITVKELDADLARMKRTLDMVYERLDNLNVKAPVDGQLAMLEGELGQQIASGSAIAQIYDLSGHKIESWIDEHYIDRVNAFLKGRITKNDSIYKLQIRKIFPEVKEGKFRVDMHFTENKPALMRNGQSYYINLELGDPQKALLLPKGAFFQSSGGQWAYVLDPSEEYAYKRSIKIGKQNPKYYEVLEGLEVGEKVIISGYEAFGDNEKLVLQ